MKITEDIIYAGVNDHQVDLFEASVQSAERHGI